MRMKRSVNFRMAPKKVNKGKGAAAEPTQEEGWNTSKCSQSDLETLVSAGLLVPRFAIQWHPALGKDHLYKNTGGNCCFCTLSRTGIGVFLFFFLFWSPALLQDPASSLDPQFLCLHFYLRVFVRSFSGHRAPFWTLSIHFPLETTARLLCFRCSRRCGSST